MLAGGQQFADMAVEEQPLPTLQAAPVQPKVPPVERQQTPVAAAAPEDRTTLLERFLRLRPPTSSGDCDPHRAESWVHELECTFETMDCAELDQVRRLDQITWAEFLVAFHGEFLPDYVCRERRDLFHELVQGDLTVGQYHQRFLQLLRHVPHVAASEQARTEQFISGLRSDLRWAMAGHLCDTLAVAVARAMALERECQFQRQQSGGSGRSSPYQRPSGSRGSVSSSSSSGTSGAVLTSKLKRLFARGGRHQYRQQRRQLEQQPVEQSVQQGAEQSQQDSKDSKLRLDKYQLMEKLEPWTNRLQLHLEEGDTPVVAFWLLGFYYAWLCSSFSGRAVCVGVGRQPFWGFPEGVSCVPVPAGLVLVASQLCRFCGGCHANALEGLSGRQVVIVTWDPQPRTSVRGSSPGGGCPQVMDLEQKGKTMGTAAWSHRSVSPFGSPDPWAAFPVFRFLVGAEGPGAGVVTVNMPPRTRRQVRELVERNEFESDRSVAAEHVSNDAQPQIVLAEGPLASTPGRLGGVSVQTWTPTLTLASRDVDANFSDLHAQQSCKLLKQGMATIGGMSPNGSEGVLSP
ncbi:hypothetical protein Taro_012623 [Colocasia esculenta]|uniref:Retrotransposon gag domain-containing protein n=1 Tax=Colocasia esculenta TaxID=4460 RepID=A0A843UE26_COLES|nr:hypothetical protein [Colocasia esculenta]